MEEGITLQDLLGMYIRDSPLLNGREGIDRVRSIFKNIAVQCVRDQTSEFRELGQEGSGEEHVALYQSLKEEDLRLPLWNTVLVVEAVL